MQDTVHIPGRDLVAQYFELSPKDRDPEKLFSNFKSFPYCFCAVLGNGAAPTATLSTIPKVSTAK
jgi:hypothetical protein